MKAFLACLSYASTCHHQAFRYVSFLVQMVGESFKTMLVMMWGMTGSGMRYGATDCVLAGAITRGVTEFLTSGLISSSEDSSGRHGLMLLGELLVLDRFASAFQGK